MCFSMYFCLRLCVMYRVLSCGHVPHLNTRTHTHTNAYTHSETKRQTETSIQIQRQSWFNIGSCAGLAVDSSYLLCERYVFCQKRLLKTLSYYDHFFALSELKSPPNVPILRLSKTNHIVSKQ